MQGVGGGGGGEGVGADKEGGLERTDSVSSMEEVETERAGVNRPERQADRQTETETQTERESERQRDRNGVREFSSVQFSSR